MGKNCFTMAWDGMFDVDGGGGTGGSGIFGRSSGGGMRSKLSIAWFGGGGGGGMEKIGSTDTGGRRTSRNCSRDKLVWFRKSASLRFMFGTRNKYLVENIEFICVDMLMSLLPSASLFPKHLLQSSQYVRRRSDFVPNFFPVLGYFVCRQMSQGGQVHTTLQKLDLFLELPHLFL